MTINTTPQAPQLPQQPAPTQSWFARHKILTGIGALVAVLLVGSALDGGEVTTTAASGSARSASKAVSQTGSDPASRPQQAAESRQGADQPSESGNVAGSGGSGEPTSAYTVAKEQAIDSAKSYLQMGGFSRAGLIQQLTSKAGEGFSRADAVFAVNHIKVDWNKQAVASAKSYLQMGGFSRAGLIQQLTSKFGEQFTLAQATYAANHLGLGSPRSRRIPAGSGGSGNTVAQEQAIDSAKSYLQMGGFSRAGLIQQLTSKAGEGFSRADAVFAVNHIKVDWNKQAVASAKSYLQMGGFSRAGLIQQLTSKFGEQFTLAQATYAANHVGL